MQVMAVRPSHAESYERLERGELNDDTSNWWIPDTECVLGMLRTAGFRYFSRPIYLTENRLLLMASKHADSRLDLNKLR